MATEMFNGFIRLSDFPLDERSIFSNYIDANNYAASDPTAYAGQIIAVVDEVERDVFMYNLIFSSDESRNFDIQNITAGIGAIKFINDLAPDEDGNITITGEDILVSVEDARTIAEVLTIVEDISFTSSELELLFSKIINVERITGLDTDKIKNLNDAINLEYLQQTQATIMKGSTRTVQALLDNTGRDNSSSDWYDFENGNIITRVAIQITEAYEEVGITLKIGSHILAEPDDIFETEIGVYIIEPSLKLELTTPSSLDVFLDGTSETGSAIIYIEFAQNPYDSIQL
jgi:hypothetical protein